MRALRLVEERSLVLEDVAEPAAPGPGEVSVRVEYVAVNHLDLYSFRGMAFARRKLPIVVGAEALCVVEDVGRDVTTIRPGQRVVPYPGEVCMTCEACVAGRENLCERMGGILGFHVDGMARERAVLDARRLLLVPDGAPSVSAACAAVTLATVEHMLFDNAKLRANETALVHAGGSGIGTTAIRMAKAVGAVVIATVGNPAKVRRAHEIGADHVIDYESESFPAAVRRLTGRRGVDVVFEHVGAKTWEGSLASLKKGGRLVTCGATTGPEGRIDLMQLFNRQIRIIGSFGGRFDDIRSALAKLARGEDLVVIDSVLDLERHEEALDRLAKRDVFGKLLLRIDGAGAAS